VSESEPEYVRRRRENERERNEAARRKLERRLVRIEVVTALGIWATVVATAIAIVDVRRSNNRQIEGLVTQQKLMQGQLDTMIAQQRPWISATPRLDLPLIRDVTPNRSPDLSVPVTVDLKNHGASPATNIVIYSMIIPASASHDSERLIQARKHFAPRQSRHRMTQRESVSVFFRAKKSTAAALRASNIQETPLYRCSSCRAASSTPITASCMARPAIGCISGISMWTRISGKASRGARTRSERRQTPA
jgi:hypothetical protein